MRLMRTVTWRSSVLLAIGAGLQVTVLMGAMAGELGNIHVFVWASAALVGLAQCWRSPRPRVARRGRIVQVGEVGVGE